MRIEQKLCKVKIFQLQSMSNAIRGRSKVCVQEFSYFVSGLDIQLEQSYNNSPVRKKLLQVAKYDESYPLFFEQLMEVKVSRRESGDMGSIPDEC